MEIFVDGGLFELFIAAAFGYAINFIFLRKYLLIIYSAIAIMSPIFLYFFNNGEIHNWIAGICIINAILLVTMLWKYRFDFPGKPLVDLENIKTMLNKVRLKATWQKTAKREIGKQNKMIDAG